MSKLSPDARDLIEAARAGGEKAPARARERVRALVLAHVGAGVAAGSATALGASSTAAKTALSAGLLFKCVAAVGIASVTAAVVVGAGWAGGLGGPPPIVTGLVSRPLALSTPVREVTPASKPPAVVSPPTSLDPPLPPAPAVIPAKPAAEPRVQPVEPGPGAVPSQPSLDGPWASDPRPKPRAPAEPLPAVRHGTSPAPPSSLEAETALLEQAQAELRAGHPERALAVLDDHDAQLKGGVLREEQHAARILALCAAGRTGEARAEAARFLAASPRSPMAERVRSSCAGQASP